MTFVRSVFIFAIVMLIVGMVGSRIMLQNVFGPSAKSIATVVVAQEPTSTSGPRSMASAPSKSVVKPHPSLVSTHQHRSMTRTATRTRPTATPRPIPSPTTGTVTLARYWVDQSAARHGNTVALGYVINNQTGRSMRVMLGASLKSSRALSWAAQSLSDPAHDVVAIVPPGVSVHTRFFTLPSRLRPGTYDVAWGLRNATNGRRAGLVAAPSALSVVR